jgi:uncharacterized membrane protein (UPF0127 family)
LLVAVNETRSAVLADRVDRATAGGERLRGLLGRGSLPAGEGLWITPCSSVHTLFMRFPIDVLFLDRTGTEAVALIERMVPWRVTRVYLRAGSALELPAGTLTRTGTQVGDRLTIGRSLAAGG